MRPRLLVILALTGLAAGCGPTNHQTYEKYRPVGDALARGVGAVKKAIEAAPDPAPDAACEKAGLSLNGIVSGEGHERRTSTGNTELVAYHDLAAPAGRQWSDSMHDLETRNPTAYMLAVSGPSSTVARFYRWFQPGGDFVGGGSSASDRTSKETLDGLERVKGVRYLLVTRAAPVAAPAETRFALFLTEFPDGKAVCGFSVAGQPDPEAKNESYRLMNRRTGQIVGGGVTDAVGRSSRRNALAALRAQLKRRFGLALPRYIGE